MCQIFGDVRFSELEFNIRQRLSLKIGLIAVFDAILTGRQSGQKLQCLYGNPIANYSVCMGIQSQITSSKIEFFTIFESKL